MHGHFFGVSESKEVSLCFLALMILLPLKVVCVPYHQHKEVRDGYGLTPAKQTHKRCLSILTEIEVAIEAADDSIKTHKLLWVRGMLKEYVTKECHLALML